MFIQTFPPLFIVLVIVILAAQTTVGSIGVKVWVYKGDVVGSNKLRQDKIAAEANLASGGPATGRVKSVKSRVEAAVGETKKSRILEAGGGKKTNESSSKIVEAGGGNRISFSCNFILS